MYIFEIKLWIRMASEYWLGNKIAQINVSAFLFSTLFVEWQYKLNKETGKKRIYKSCTSDIAFQSLRQFEFDYVMQHTILYFLWFL